MPLRPHPLWLAGLLAMAGAAQAQPVASCGLQLDRDSTDTPLTGGEVDIEISIDNSGDAPGFGPGAVLIVPPGFSLVSATALDLTARSRRVGVFPAAPGNELLHPVHRQPVNGPEGATLYHIQVPVSGLAADAPEIVIEATLGVAEGAAVRCSTLWTAASR